MNIFPQNICLIPNTTDAHALTSIYRVYKKTEQIQNRPERREAAQTIKFMIRIYCLGTYNVE